MALTRCREYFERSRSERARGDASLLARDHHSVIPQAYSSQHLDVLLVQSPAETRWSCLRVSRRSWHNGTTVPELILNHGSVAKAASRLRSGTALYSGPTSSRSTGTFSGRDSLNPRYEDLKNRKVLLEKAS